MILSYGDKRTESFAAGEFVRPFSGFAQQATKGWIFWLPRRA
jgi:hypothetical protein